MKAIPKFAIDIEKWLVDVETDDGEIVPVGRVINEVLQIFKLVEWDTKELAEEWIKSKGMVLG